MNSFARPYFCHRKGIRPHSQQAGYTPMQLVDAYPMVRMSGTPLPVVKLGVISLGGAISIADIDTAFSSWGLPFPTVDAITIDGATQVNDPQGADIENALDVEWIAGIWSVCTGQAAHVVICFAPNTGTGIANACKALTDAGCGVIGCSWGQAFTQWASSDVSTTESAGAYALSKGCTPGAATGDNSADDGTNTPTPDCPSCLRNWWAVGGTSLQLNPDGSIASEAAWGDGNSHDEGGGGGFNTTIPTPAYQLAAIAGKGSGRGVPDCSSAADPQYGAAVFVGGQWQEIGGTSWATPTEMGWVAVCKAIALSESITPIADLGPFLYPVPSAFHDITVGSDGWPTEPGWDAATGLGTRNGPNYLQAFLGNPPTPPVPVPSPVPVPTPLPPVPTPLPIPPIPLPPFPWPIPVPTPVPGQLTFDQVLMALEVRLANRPFLLQQVRLLQSIGDALMLGNMPFTTVITTIAQVQPQWLPLVAIIQILAQRILGI